VATPEGSTSAPLSMAQASVFVPDFKDFTADAVYAGDQQGNVWRLDLTGTTAYAQPTKIASLLRDSVAQPITTRPLIEIDPASQKRYVFVGTGRLLADSDISSRSVQGFYALVDGTSSSGGFYTATTLPRQYVFPLTRGQLNADTDLLTGIGSAPVSAMGWYVDLATDSTSGIAERVNVDPTANQGIVAFAANLPDGVVCSPSGKSRQFALTFAGGRSVLVNEYGAVIAATAYHTGLTTDLAILRADGKLRLFGGYSTGEFVRLPGELATSTGLTRLNWREVPAED
jgi:type IV pilus assembly protein PilY1